MPSGKECCKQSDPEQFGCPSVLRLLDVYGESETPSTQHRRLRLLRSSKTGEGERKFTESFFLKRGESLFFCIWEMMVHSTFSPILHFIYVRKKTRKILSVLKNSHIYRPEARSVHRWTGKPRPGLPSSSGGNFPPVSGEDERMFIESGDDCCKQSDPEHFKLSVGHNGCKSVRGVGNPVHVWYTRA